MAHPKVSKKIGNRLWHLEDQHLTHGEALALRKHLSKTEEKHAKINKTSNGHEVWWATK
jgi:hypothetical protein